MEVKTKIELNIVFKHAINDPSDLVHTDTDDVHFMPTLLEMVLIKLINGFFSMATRLYTAAYNHDQASLIRLTDMPGIIILGLNGVEHQVNPRLKPGGKDVTS